MFLRLLVPLACLPAVARADGWDDFANNLATDLAPLIQLFAESATKQFLSESLGIWDNIIFAAAPLGILTAVVSAIRVCGSPSLKAFIGRAQESSGSAEVELLSCTSETTAELWSDGGIVRVYGQPDILEFVKRDETFDDSDDENAILNNRAEADEDTAGIHKLDSVLAQLSDLKDIGEEPKNHGWALVKKNNPDRSSSGGPNLSLNIGIKRRPEWVFWVAATIGVTLQIGVLAFAGLTVYKFEKYFIKDGAAPAVYGFPITLAGTMAMCTGMFGCAYLIEQSTAEDYYRNEGSSRVFWVQPGGQKIGDQIFGAFIAELSSRYYIKSSKVDIAHRFTIKLWIAVALTAAGFVGQFVGLRALHPSITLAQLGSTMTMAVIRAGLRTSRMEEDQNIVVKDLDKFQQGQLPGHELDFLALRFGKAEDIALYLVPRPSNEERARQDASGVILDPSEGSLVSFNQAKNGPVHSATKDVIRIRARFAKLMGDSLSRSSQTLDVSVIADHLKKAIENTLEYLVSVGLVDSKTKNLESSWQIGVHCDNEQHAYTMRLRKEVASTWTLEDRHCLEAILGLWSWSFVQYVKTSHGVRLVIQEGTGPQKYNETDYIKWVQRRMKCFNEVSEEYEDGRLTQRIFGWPTDEQNPKGVMVRPSSSITEMCAQDLYMMFLDQTLHTTSKLSGKITLRSKTTLQLENTRIEALAEAFEKSQLGSREDAYTCIVPILMRQTKMPTLEESYKSVMRRAIRDGDKDTLKALLDHEMPTGNLHRDGRTALHFAVVEKSEDIMKMLLKQKEGVDAKTKKGLTPLHIACRKGKKKTVMFLLDKAGADINAKTNEDQTPIYVALMKEKTAVCKYLIQVKKPDLNIVAKGGLTALNLEIGVWKGSYITAKWLLQAGADPTIKDKNGWTAPLRAWSSRDPRKLKLFGKKYKVPKEPIGIPPKQLVTDNLHAKYFKFSEDALTAEQVEYKMPEDSKRKPPKPPARFQLKSLRCLCGGIYTAYFEVTILEMGIDSHIGIGLARSGTTEPKMPGWTERTWGYHSDDGLKYHARNTGYKYGPTYGKGDVIGMGVDFKTWTCFYTKNGASLGTAFWKLKGRLWTVVAFRGTGSKIQMNFGDKPFLWQGTYEVDKRRPSKKNGDMNEADSPQSSSPGYTSTSESSSDWTDGTSSDHSSDDSYDTDYTTTIDDDSSDDDSVSISGTGSDPDSDSDSDSATKDKTVDEGAASTKANRAAPKSKAKQAPGPSASNPADKSLSKATPTDSKRNRSPKSKANSDKLLVDEPRAKRAPKSNPDTLSPNPNAEDSKFKRSNFKHDSTVDLDSSADETNPVPSQRSKRNSKIHSNPMSDSGPESPATNPLSAAGPSAGLPAPAMPPPPRKKIRKGDGEEDDSEEESDSRPNTGSKTRSERDSVDSRGSRASGKQVFSPAATAGPVAARANRDSMGSGETGGSWTDDNSADAEASSGDDSESP